LSGLRAVELRGLGIRLGFAPLGALRQHEEVFADAARSLALAMESEGVLLDPLMVDSSTLTVLDGAHRASALASLGARWAAVAAVDYGSPEVSVGRWLRAIDPGAAREAALSLGMAEEGPEAARSAVDSHGPRVAVLMPGGPSYLGPALGSALEAHRLARSIWARPGSHPELIPDDEVGRALESGRAVIYVSAPSKLDVLRAASSGELFPPRSTRHRFGARPLGLGVPLGVLRSDSEPDLSPLEEAARSAVLQPGDEGHRGERPLIVRWAARGRCAWWRRWPSRARCAATRRRATGPRAAQSKWCRAASCRAWSSR
jgi:hypothetical protein